jgi:hypothetical protein
MKKLEVILNLDVEQYYQIINVLRDSCGCNDCVELTNELMMQRRADVKAGL